MARETKFRAKNTKNEWVYGQYAELAIQGDYLAPSIIDAGFVHVVNPETLGQYTGLTDKNGKEIYVGDIIKARGWSDTFVIKYNNCGLIAKNTSKNLYAMDVELIKGDNLEVIDNIHDNPELI